MRSPRSSVIYLQPKTEETMPATKSRPKAAGRKKAAKPKTTLRTEPAIAAVCHQVPVTTMEIPTAAISSCRFQPRQEFPAEEIEHFAESIAANGLIHPIAVRPDGDGYEIVDGERRLRACRLLQLDTIRAEVGEWTDAQVMRIVVASALQRRDLNPLEEGLAFQRAIEAGVAAGPTELARQLGVSQGHVSNRIRLLELPEKWKTRVISGEIPPTHARTLVKFKDYPLILNAVQEESECSWSPIHRFNCTDREFDERLNYVAYHETRPLTGTWRSADTHYRDVPVCKFTEEQLPKLQVIEVSVRGKKIERRAANVRLWDKLQAEYMASRDAAAEKKAEKAAAKKKQAKAKDLSLAEKKAAAAEEKRKAKERQKVFQKRLYEWHLNWLRYLIAARLRLGAAMQELLVIATYFTDLHHPCGFQPLAGLKDACKAEAPDVTVNTKKSWFGVQVDAMGTLVQLGEDEIEPVLGQTMAQWFWCQKDGPVAVASAADLEPLATYLAIDQTGAWRLDQAGPLSAAYWNLHNKEQLLELAKELGVEVEAAAKKTTLVDAFMARNDVEVEPLAMPAEITSIKKPK